MQMICTDIILILYVEIYMFLIILNAFMQKPNSLHSYLIYSNCFVIQYIFMQMVCTDVRVMSRIMVVIMTAYTPRPMLLHSTIWALLGLRAVVVLCVILLFNFIADL